MHATFRDYSALASTLLPLRNVIPCCQLLGEDLAKDIKIFAGDVVPKKKPDPAIYNLAAEDLKVDPAK